MPAFKTIECDLLSDFTSQNSMVKNITVPLGSNLFVASKLYNTEDGSYIQVRTTEENEIVEFTVTYLVMDKSIFATAVEKVNNNVSSAVSTATAVITTYDSSGEGVKTTNINDAFIKSVTISYELHDPITIEVVLNGIFSDEDGY